MNLTFTFFKKYWCKHFLVQTWVLWLSLQEVQSPSAGRQGDKAESYHGSVGPPWQHGDHSSQQSDAEGVELHHRKPCPRPHGNLNIFTDKMMTLNPKFTSDMLPEWAFDFLSLEFCHRGLHANNFNIINLGKSYKYVCIFSVIWQNVCFFLKIILVIIDLRP